MSNINKHMRWDQDAQTAAVKLLSGHGKVIVSPTKVGYIVMASDVAGLVRKFSAKNRKRNKPGVVLCSSMEQLRELAQMNDEIETFYQYHWDNDILLGCILPWKKSGKAHIPTDGSDELMMDARGTSCFVIRFGKPSEEIVSSLWKIHGKLVFASSANPSGKGNRGRVNGIGERIEHEVDLILEADDYVHSIQADADENTRYEQGVMVSMVDDVGNLIPAQQGRRQVTPAPILIRKGLSTEFIMNALSAQFDSWDYRRGAYY